MKIISILMLAPLACTSLAFSSITPSQSSSSQGWRQTPRSDSVRGAYTRFALTGKFLKLPHGDNSNGPALAVDCNPAKKSRNFMAGNLLIGVPLKIDYVEPSEIHGTSYYPKVAVRYRLDEAKEQKQNWTPGTDKTSAVFSKDELEKMLRARTVEITARDDRGSDIVMQFDMSDPAIVEKGCDVDARKKK
jgi:hypothetical protein